MRLITFSSLDDKRKCCGFKIPAFKFFNNNKSETKYSSNSTPPLLTLGTYDIRYVRNCIIGGSFGKAV